MLKSEIEFLRHILQESEFILKNTAGLNYDSFTDNEVLKRAVVRSLEIIGEATKKVNVDFRSKYPAVEWNGMAKCAINLFIIILALIMKLFGK